MCSYSVCPWAHVPKGSVQLIKTMLDLHGGKCLILYQGSIL